jgi:mannosyltransferase OCH1-like enzyme
MNGHFAKNVTIPKIVMQTWKNDQIPDKWKAGVESVKKYLSHWKYVLMTDENNLNLVKDYFPWYLETYLAFRYPIQRADVIRYMWLYLYGGLYLDMDVLLLSDIDHLFLHGNLFFVPSGNEPTYLTNAIMASVPRQQCWLDMLEETKKRYNGWLPNMEVEILSTTGPGMVSRIMQNGIWPYTMLPKEVLNPYSICDVVFNKPNALMQPLEGSSWITSNWKKAQQCFYCNGKEWIAIAVIIILFLVIAGILFFIGVNQCKTNGM